MGGGPLRSIFFSSRGLLSLNSSCWALCVIWPDVLAQKLMELMQFQYWPFYWPRDPVIWPLTQKN